MKHRTKILLDRLVGTPAGVALAGLARVLGAVLRRDSSQPRSPRVVVVAKFEGMGSILHSQVLCRALKAAWPAARLVYVTRSGNAAFARRVPGVDQVLALDDGNVIRAVRSAVVLLVRLWTLRPEAYFDLEVYSGVASLFATLSLARKRYGFYRKSAAFKQALHTDLVFFNTSRHVSEVYAQLLRAAQVAPVGLDLGPMEIGAPDVEEAERLLGTLGLGPGAVFITANPNASDLLLERRWPAEAWVVFLTRLLAAREEPVLLVGSPSERRWVESLREELAEPLRARVHVVAGDLSLGGFLALLRRTSLVVTSDSGPLHFAVALGVPTVSLWGPGDPRHYGPPAGGPHAVLYRPPYCSPCLYHADVPPCHGDNICMQALAPGEVLAEALALLDGKAATVATRSDAGPGRSR